MGSSYRSDVRRGSEPTMTSLLTEAATALERAVSIAYINLEGEDQYDNAAQTGGLIEALSIARRLILESIPARAAAQGGTP